MEIVEFRFKRGRIEAELVKENPLTVLVRVRAAGRTQIIKRHKEKHQVRFV